MPRGIDPIDLQEKQRQDAQRQADLNAFSKLTPESFATADKPPTWNDIFNAFNAQHTAVYGRGINRAWNTDQDAQNSKLAIDHLYTEGLADWNAAHNQNVAVDKKVLGVSAQPNAYTPDPEYHGLLNQIWETVKPALPIVLAVAGAEYLPGLLNSIGATSAGTAAEAGTAAGALPTTTGGAPSILTQFSAPGSATLAATGSNAGATALDLLAAGAGSSGTLPTALGNEAVASGTFTPGSLGSQAAAQGVLTPTQLAAAAGTGGLGALTGADALAANLAAHFNQAVASGLGPGSVGAAQAAAGLLNAGQLAAAAGVVTDGSLLSDLTKLPGGSTTNTSNTTNSNTYISGGTTGGSSSGPWNSYLTPQVSRIGAIQPPTLANPLAGLVSPINTSFTPSTSLLNRMRGVGQYAKGGEIVKADLDKFEPEFVDIIKKRTGGAPDHHHPNYNGVPLFRTGGLGKHVQGPGTGQSDDIPAMLADGEYVFDSDTVSALGDGSNKAGAAALDQMRKAIRKHKRSAPIDKIPPKAKNPLEYLRGK